VWIQILLITNEHSISVIPYVLVQTTNWCHVVSSQEILGAGVEYEKIFTEGHSVPSLTVQTK